MKKNFELIGMKIGVGNCYATLYLSNGETKECYVDNIGFKVNNDTNLALKVTEYEDKTDYSGDKPEITGKDYSKIESCVIEATRTAVDSYMYKIGVFSETVEPNMELLGLNVADKLESSISMLSSSISNFEHQLQQMEG